MIKKINETSPFTRVKIWAIANGTFLIALGCVLAVFTTIGLYAAAAPGLYMDAINPDYEVVKIFHPDAPITVWEAPGDLLFARFPVMFELYAGSFITYWAIPFYGLLGHDIMSVRIAHVCAGLVLICCIAGLTRTLTQSNLIAAAVCALIALDPTFIYALRTQAYVVIFPLIFITIALFLIARSSRPRTVLAAGILIGLSAFGYFVYLFVIPGLLLYLVAVASGTKKFRSVLSLLIGIAIGLTPYALAYGLLFADLGVPQGLAWIHSALAGLHVVPSDNSYGARVASILTQSQTVLSNQWLWRTFWQNSHEDAGQTAKAFLLVLLPLIAFAVRSTEGRAKASFLLVACPALSFVVCATYFGPRLGGHDLASVLTFAYVSSAIAIALFISTFPSIRRPLGVVFGVIVVAVFVSNVSATASVATKLERESGSGLYSSIISAIPQNAQKSPADAQTPYIFWSWGELMPFIYETGGSIPAYASDQLLPAICKYGSAKIVFLNDDAVSIPAAFPRSDLRISNDDLLHDPSSGLPYRIVSAKAAHPGPNCASTTIASPAEKAPDALASTATATATGVALTAPIDSAQYPSGVLKGTRPENRVGGIYAVANGEEKCCWVSRNVAFSMENPARGESVVLSIYVPSIAPWNDDPGTVSSIGSRSQILDTKALKPGLQEVTLKTDERAFTKGIQTVRIHFSQEANPKNLGLNGDERNLSAIVVSVSPE